jgi:poly-gamma-glutamate synthesis protein (capsule biosynthesis protein)
MKRILILLLVCLVLICSVCYPGKKTEQPGQTEQSGQPSEPETITVRLMAVGDNLLHDSVSYTAQQPDGSYDYSALYAAMKPVLTQSDLTFINQEVMLTGQVSAYPSLAAKGECADALRDAGFNLINLATNHTLDKGISGLEACLQTVHSKGFDAVMGAFRTKEESTQQIIVEKKGIRFGFLAYTYNLNGKGLGADDAWRVALIEEQKIRAEVSALRQNCDYLIVSMHWGQEYKDLQNAKQESQAKLLAELGVDLVIGTHPHVIQPAVWYDRPDGGKMYCTYSLGNFISNQRKWATMLGGLLDITLEFTPDGNLKQVVDAGVIPTVTHYETTTEGSRGHRVCLLQDYTEALASVHGIRDHAGALTLNWLQTHASAVLGDQLRSWKN